MTKIALVTEGTDGIGKATAVELARHGYCVHILGRNLLRGQATLAQLQAIGPAQTHRFFQVDLATLAANHQFLQAYQEDYDQLDLLILNANAVTRPLSLTLDGIETTFAVGYISRYLFSLKLNSLLVAARNARVIHIGARVLRGNLNLEKVFKYNYGIARATLQSYRADAHFVFFLHARQLTPVPHEVFAPGLVNTKQVLEGGRLLGRLLNRQGRWLGMIELAEAGQRLVRHITQTDASAVSGKFFHLEKPQKLRSGDSRRLTRCRRLMAFSESITDTPLAQYLDS